MSEVRSAGARVGIAALNLLSPGLGLLRIGRLRPAIAFILLPLALILLLVLYFALIPTMTFPGFAAAMFLVLVLTLVTYVVSMVLSWRWSRFRGEGPAWWSRWYALLGAVVAVMLIQFGLSELPRGFYKLFYLPAESMAPTLLKNDRLVASMRGGGVLRRGDVIIFDTVRGDYIKRVAGLPGDRIALVGGVVFLNGRAVEQRLERVDRVEPRFGNSEARRLAERFPGEAGSHEIYDSGDSLVDDFPETIVRPGHVFVLGDHRDMSADSRVPAVQDGVEQVPIARIRGKALFHWLFSSREAGKPV